MMAENEEPEIRRTVTLGSGNRIVYKTDGKSYLQIISAGRVVREREIFADQVEEQIRRDPPSPREATAPINQMSPDQLRRVINNIESLRPNAQGRYTYQGQTFTEGALDRILNQYKTRLSELEAISRRSEEQASRPNAGVDQEVKRVNEIRTRLSQKLQDIKDELRTVETVSGQNNLNSWRSYYQTQFDRLTKYVDDLSNGRVRAGSVDTNFVDISVEQATVRPTTGGAAAQPGVVYGGVPGAGQGMAAPAGTPFTPGAGETVFGGTFVQPGTMMTGQTGTTGTTATTTTAATTSGTVSTPSGGGAVVTGPAGTTGVSAGPAYTDPATQVTYQPGQQIGGEDRALPNGGAVVDGVYIPPGIDYTWLGSQLPEDWKTAAQELYGAYYDMIKNDPQISKLLEDAIKNSWSPEKFQVELEKTNWWRTTTANARQFEILETTDPATARAQLDNRMAVVRETAQRLGITLDNESLERIARNAITLGFELTAQVEDLVGSEAIRTAGGVSQLRYGYLGNSLRESARKYGVSLSDVTFNEWLNKIAVGSESVETFESYANQIARTLYPTLSSGFDRGLTFGQMTDPYAQVASRILEIPTAQVDFTDPKWAQAFTMKNDKGEQVPMSFGEWADYLRTNESFGWEYTDDAKNRAFTVVNRLAELFGAA